MHLFFPSDSSSSWWAVRATSGLDLGLLYGNLPIGVPAVVGDLCTDFQKQSHTVNRSDASILLFQIPLELGVHVGLGSFRDRATWRGFVLGAAWVPTLTYLKPSTGDGQGNLSLAGLELSLDLTTLDTKEERRPRQHYRFAAVVLPATQEGAPFVATMSFGAVWY
jgi:hypothetical protein